MNPIAETMLADVKCRNGQVTTTIQCMTAIAKWEEPLDGNNKTPKETKDPKGHRDAEMFSVYAMGKSRPVLLQKE